jgi:hypothetical protein
MQLILVCQAHKLWPPGIVGVNALKNEVPQTIYETLASVKLPAGDK